MKVTIEVKDLLDKIVELNPTADLTSLKGWLFDLVLDLPVKVEREEEKPIADLRPARPVIKEEHRDFHKPPETPQEKIEPKKELVNEIPAGIIGIDPNASPFSDATASGPARKVVIGGGNFRNRDRGSKLDRREEMKKISDMSGKELAQYYSDQLLSKNKKKDGQFVDEGIEGSGGGGDIEIG